MRRDKREDELIKSFLQMEGEGVDTYRRETPIEIRPQDLSPQWLDAVIAAEALSAIKDMEGGRFQQDKRLRLTIGNGHGISVVMDAAVEEEVVPNVEGASVIPIAIENSRVLYWREVLRSAVRASAHHDRARTETSLLYEHPSIVTAVDAIEKITAEGRKVLVFGRFTRPMKALEEILNARAMLRHLAEERVWPQSTIAQGDEVAVDAALAQMRLDSRWSRADVSKLLGERYSSYETRRKAPLDRVHRVIDREISGLAPRSRTVLAGAVLDILETGGFEVGDDDIAEAARRIVESLCDDDTVLNGYGVNEQEHDDVQDGRLQGKIDERIQEEYGIPRGGYARRLYGETKPHTRRNLQLKFNRANCFPYVLIAQSQVGREGLNLHEQCRDVVLLHPEWNPGVVEQQIGRVDRLGSRWCKDFDVWKEAGAVGEPPRIEIRPIMFMGTYDEHNWSVLKRRWELLRGQLHGIVVSGADMRESGDADKCIAAELNNLAPKLSPRSAD
ncbi:MAG TPA: helicase-related protein [Rhizomicrobium sp.]|nr:helicase-related protein [Rhizomicrobium sp.]